MSGAGEADRWFTHFGVPDIPRVSDPEKIRSVFADSGVEICCLASSIAMTQNKKQDAQAADELRLYINTAQKLGCSIVKIFDTQVKPGWSRASTGVLLGDWLLPLADYAADHDVVIGIENALSFRNAKEMWAIVDQVVYRWRAHERSLTFRGGIEIDLTEEQLERCAARLAETRSTPRLHGRYRRWHSWESAYLAWRRTREREYGAASPRCRVGRLFP